MRVPNKQPVSEKQIPASAVRVVQSHTVTAPQAGIDVDVVDSLQRRWLLAAGIFLIFGTAGAFWIYTHLKPTYLAETTIYVSPRVLKDTADHVDELSYVALLNQQIMTILHYDTLSQVLHRLDAEGHGLKLGHETEQQTVERLKATLIVRRIPDSYEIAIDGTDSDASNVARVVNTVAETYLERGSGEDLSERSARVAVLKQEKSALEQQLKQTLEVATRLSGTLQVANLGKIEALPDDAVLTQMRVAFATAHQKRVEAEQQMAATPESSLTAEAERILSDPSTRSLVNNLLQGQSALRSRLEGAPAAQPGRKPADSDVNSIAAANEELLQLDREIGQKTADFNVLRQNKTDNHPDVIDSKASLAALNKRRGQLVRNLAVLNGTRDQASTEDPYSASDNRAQKTWPELVQKVTAQLKDKIRTQVEQARLTEIALGRDVTERAEGVEKSSRDLHEAQDVNANVDRLRSHLRNIQDRIDMPNLQGDPNGFLRIFSVAQTPLAPQKNQKKKAAAAFLFAALLASLAIPALLDVFDPRVYNPASLERTLGFPPVGITLEEEPGAEELAEEHLRRLAAGIERGIARGARTVVLAGVKPGVPRTLGEAIARIMIERGYRTMVINADRQKFRLKPIVRAAEEKETKAVDLYASVPKDVEQDYDVVLISTPPLLLYSDAELIASEGDLTLMVVQAGVHTRKDVQRAERLLERLNVKAVGAILNGVRMERAGRTMKREFKEFLTLESSQTDSVRS